MAVSDFGARKKNHLKHDTSGSIFPTPPRQRSNSRPREGLTRQIPHSPGIGNSQMPGVCPRGVGMLKFRFDRRIRSMKTTPLTRPLSIGSLSKCVFDTLTATGSELFSPLICLHTTAFTSPSIFSPLERLV